MKSSKPVSADELLRLFDGALDGPQASEVQARLSDADRLTLAAWQTQKEQLRAWGQAIVSEQTPVEVLETSTRAGQAHASASRWQRWGSMAASVLLAFSTGWVTRGWNPGNQMARAVPTPGSVRVDFPAQAALAHATFAPEVKHPVEVTAAQQAHLVQWLSKRLGRDLHIPDLSTQGFQLMGGRLLPGNTGARALFMYERADGLRASLYVGAAQETLETNTMTQVTAFAFSQHSQVSSFYWVDQGFGYSLSADLARPELLSLAQSVYKQL